ncbi:hypothetical protein [Chitinibacter sp. S2-10]|uniref:hypothetical protein n=1 Tax=Chitinibacter sp. S2-10 TaxID=3373597 RepID=UPI00397760B4
MKSEVILLLTQQSLAAYRYDKSGTVPLACWARDENTLGDLSHFVAQLRNSCFYLLTDLVDEELQIETIPRLARKDRLTLQARKLAQRFVDTPYRQAQSLTGADDCLQLSALNNPAVILQIVDILLAERAPLLGIYSVALITQAMVARLGSGAPHLLLMSCSEAGFLRQSYFTSHGLRFTRLASFHYTQPLVLQAQDIASEVRRARQYLATLRLIGHDEMLTVVCLFDRTLAANQQAIRLALNHDADGIVFNAEPGASGVAGLALAEVADRLKLPCCGCWHDLLFGLLIIHRLPNQYAPAETLKYRNFKVLSRGILLSSLLILIFAAILSISYLRQANQWQSLARTGEQAIARQRAIHHSAQQASPVADEAQVRRLQGSVRLYQSQIAAAPQIEPVLQKLSQVLLNHPDLIIDGVSWSATEKMTQKVASTDENRPVQILVFGGRLQNSTSYRAALSQINRLVLALQSWPGAQVSVKQWPLDLRPEVAINSAAGAHDPDGQWLIEVKL